MLTKRHYTKGNSEIVRLCTTAKELYNRCNYIMRQHWFKQNNYELKQLPNICYLRNEMKNLECFKNFGNTKTAMQTIRQVLNDWSNYRKALTSYSKNQKKFIKCPKPPNYKNKMTQIIFYNETLKGGNSKKLKILPNLTANNECFSVPYQENYRQVIVTPKTFGFMIDVIYDEKKELQEKKRKLDKNKVCTIDLGVNNLCAITYDQHRPILINGRIVKSINQWYNKRPCKKRLKKRYFRLENYFHHTSKFIIDLCVKYRIGKIVIGKNDGWKQKVKMKKSDKQNFLYISHQSLLQKIIYKASAYGIDVNFTEEAYTSKASFYDNDPLPRYDESVPELSGHRKDRGGYLTKDGFFLNADINGSLNIGRKVIPEFLGIRDRSLVARPVVVNPLRKLVGEGQAV